MPIPEGTVIFINQLIHFFINLIGFVCTEHDLKTVVGNIQNRLTAGHQITVHAGIDVCQQSVEVTGVACAVAVDIQIQIFCKIVQIIQCPATLFDNGIQVFDIVIGCQFFIEQISISQLQTGDTCV